MLYFVVNLQTGKKKVSFHPQGGSTNMALRDDKLLNL